MIQEEQSSDSVPDAVRWSPLVAEYGPGLELGWAVGATLLFGSMSAAAFYQVAASGGLGNLVGGLITGTLAIHLLRRTYRWWSRRIEVHELGLVQIESGRARGVAWSAIEKVCFSVRRYRMVFLPAGTEYSVRITTEAGDHLEFDHQTKNTRSLLQTVRDRSFPHLYEKAIASLRRGREVEFGNFIIARQGIVHKGRSLAWSELQDVDVQNGEVIVLAQRGGKAKVWAKERFESMCNVDVILAVLQQRPNL